ncbi:MAG TPA: prolipoprotein diacylglyceryl transferase [Verrucomicrobiae bacterium]|nr:prolipoprotein diacylglyceryl transferase [Verrucomicrobiae bacterium]
MHDIAFKLGPLTVHWYGILVAMGFLAGLWTASRRAQLVGIPPERVFDLGPWLILGGIAGGRILYVISYWNEEFAAHPFPAVFRIWEGGLIFYGGLIGATLGAMFYLHWKKLPMWKMADVLAPSVALGSAFGRIGCLMHGCCFGRVCSTGLPWGIQFPNGSPAWDKQHGDGLVGALDPSLPVHPTEIYDSLLNFCFYLFLAWLFRRKKFDGQVFAVYLIGYAILRSFVEYFRGDYPVHYLGGIATPAQVVSIGIIVGGLLLLFLLPRQRPVEKKA